MFYNCIITPNSFAIDSSKLFSLFTPFFSQSSYCNSFLIYVFSLYFSQFSYLILYFLHNIPYFKIQFLIHFTFNFPISLSISRFDLPVLCFFKVIHLPLLQQLIPLFFYLFLNFKSFIFNNIKAEAKKQLFAIEH